MEYVKRTELVKLSNLLITAKILKIKWKENP